MLEIKAHHKELKRAVNEIEDKRKKDRFVSWSLLKEAKKLKLQTKERLNETKQ
jgi:hypothetical protein